MDGCRVGRNIEVWRTAAHLNFRMRFRDRSKGQKQGRKIWICDRSLAALEVRNALRDESLHDGSRKIYNRCSQASKGMEVYVYVLLWV